MTDICFVQTYICIARACVDVCGLVVKGKWRHLVPASGGGGGLRPYGPFEVVNRLAWPPLILGLRPCPPVSPAVRTEKKARDICPVYNITLVHKRVNS